MAANYGKTGSGEGWVQGDFNYDGTVNALDFNALATNYGQVLSSAQPALGANVVPEAEPASGGTHSAWRLQPQFLESENARELKQFGNRGMNHFFWRENGADQFVMRRFQF